MTHSILLFGTTPRALYTDFVISAPTPYFHSAPAQTRGSQASVLAPLAMPLQPGLSGLPGLPVYQSKPWGTLANVPEVQSAQSPALLCSCSSDLHCLWACASGTPSRNQKTWKTVPCVQLEKAQDPFNKGFVN